MVQIIVGQDGALRAIAWLLRFLPDVQPEIPPNYDWGAMEDPLIVVAEVGGSGLRDVAFDDMRLAVDVYATTQEAASETAHRVRGLIRAWPQHEAGVYFMDEILRPTWDPDEDTRVPRYRSTIAMSFRGSIEEIPPLP